jgi:hypothetical protein
MHVFSGDISPFFNLLSRAAAAARTCLIGFLADYVRLSLGGRPAGPALLLGLEIHTKVNYSQDYKAIDW